MILKPDYSLKGKGFKGAKIIVKKGLEESAREVSKH